MAKITLWQVHHQVMVAADSNNRAIVIGRSSDPEPTWVGVKPAELLLMAAASCSAWDVIEILNKQREPLENIQVVCTGEQKSEPPYNFTQIHLHYQVRGAVSPQKLEKAIQLSQDKYCSVIATLRLGIPVTFDYEIVA